LEKFDREPAKDGKFERSQHRIVELKRQTPGRARKSQQQRKSNEEQGDCNFILVFLSPE